MIQIKFMLNVSKTLKSAELFYCFSSEIRYLVQSLINIATMTKFYLDIVAMKPERLI